ncbi:MAG: hypothetical protein K0R38_3469 [Polyangiaceae bacterium]|jgi:anti-sigma factor RsiW|nr:hypothetical protein [Polyangiaceae bacterium]
MTAACPRSFEVEALRDGRLGELERARFQAHLAACPACKREAQALEELADALSASTAERGDELHVRRERTRLLAAFDARLVPPRARASSLWWGVAAVMALAGALVLFTRTPPPTPVVAPLASAAPPLSIRADSNAKWSRRSEAERDVVALESGALSIHVQAGRSRRLLVELPDGELEDIGTTFSVSAAAGRTTRVTVQEGSVVLRLSGKSPIALGAGEAWTPTPIAAPTAPSSLIAPAEPPRTAPRPNPKTAVSAEPPADSAADFRAAMAAFNQGDVAHAAELFTSFVRQHPQDSRAEDAAYLRALAHQRSGDLSATERAAREYLKRYPHGFRRAEVETLLGGSP